MGAGAGDGEVYRTVIPISARSALTVLGYLCTKLVMGRTSFSSAARAESFACRAPSAAAWAATCAGYAPLHAIRASSSGFNSDSSNPLTLHHFFAAL